MRKRALRDFEYLCNVDHLSLIGLVYVKLVGLKNDWLPVFKSLHEVWAWCVTLTLIQISARTYTLLIFVFLKWWSFIHRPSFWSKGSRCFMYWPLYTTPLNAKLSTTALFMIREMSPLSNAPWSVPTKKTSPRHAVPTLKGTACTWHVSRGFIRALWLGS